MDCSLDNLRSNLQEIYAAVRMDESTDPPLVANVWGTRLYISSHGWGRLWKWFYDGVKLFTGQGFSVSRLHAAMRHTHRLFEENLRIAENCSQKYQCYLNKKSAGEVVDEGRLAACRRILAAWDETTHTLLKKIREGYNPKLANLIYAGFQDQFKYRSDYAPFSCGSFKGQLSWHRKILGLEVAMRSPLPLPLLLMISLQQSLSGPETDAFDRFAKKLNKHAHKLGIRKLHRTLRAMVDYFMTLPNRPPGRTPDLAALEIALFDKGCKIFLQKDPQHILWRNTLKLGDMLVCNEREYILGGRLGAKALGEEDNNHIYAIQNEPGIVVSIGINEAVHGLKKLVAKEHGWGIKSVKYIEINPKGRFALVERLCDQLDEYRWRSQRARIDPNDESMAAPLWRLLQWLLEQERTPSNFLPKYLMFNRMGRLKSLKVSLEGEFDFNALVDFAFKSAGGNPKVFEFLMESSGLIEHRYARFYRKMVENAMKDDRHDASDIAASAGISDSRIVERGRGLYNESKALKKKCLTKLRQGYDVRRINDLDKVAGDNLLYAYNTCSGAGFLPPYLENEMVEELVRSQGLQPRTQLPL